MASTYLTNGLTAGSGTIGTVSLWVKRSNLSTSTLYHFWEDNTTWCRLRFDSSDVLHWETRDNGTVYGKFKTNRVFKDISAYYHIVVRVDTTQSTEADRFKLYVNGSEETSFSTSTYPTQNRDVKMTAQPYIGVEWDNSSGTQFFDGNMTHVHYTDGQSYAASTFGETDSTSGIWKPKTAPSVTYGSKGFFLKFENSGSMGTDSSGNGNNFTTIGGTLKQSSDTPSNVFSTINKVMQPTGASNATISNGGLTSTSSSSDYTILCSMAAKKGKWYWEVKMGNAANNRSVGVVRMDKLYQDSSLGGFYPGGNNNSTTYTSAHSGSGGFIETNTDGTRVQVTSGVTTTTTDDIIGMYLDLDGYTLKFYKNGSLQNEAALNATWVEEFVAPCARADHNQIMHFNFGVGFFGTTAVTSANADANGFGAFEYSPTLSGVNYYAWCTKNLKEFG